MKKRIKGTHYTRNLKNEWPGIICFLLLTAAILVVSMKKFDLVALLFILAFVLMTAAVGGITIYLLSREGMWIDGEEVWCRKLRKRRIEVSAGKMIRAEMSIAPIIRIPSTMVTAVNDAISIL